MGKQVSFGRWCDDLAGICGNFHGVARKDQIAVSGRVVSHDFDGLVVADVSGDVAAIMRDIGGMSSDNSEHIYCLIQASGRLLVDHIGERALLGPGDCLLIDSTKECAMTFVDEGRFLLLHMPRDAFLRSCNGNIRIGQMLTADHPLAPAIRQQIQHFPQGRHPGASVSRANSELMLGMVRLAFSNRIDFAEDINPESKDRQFTVALNLIQQNLTNPDLSLNWLAQKIGTSTRQLQRVFEFENTSFISEVRERRLDAAAARLRNRKTARRIQISDVAYDSGFRDLSNFNRGFKSRFGMAPREYLETIAG